MINRLEFYKKFKIDFGKVSQAQVDSIEAIFNEWELQKYTDIRWLAYMLATIYHETAGTMRPIEEYGKGKNYKYGKRIKHSGLSYSESLGIFYGRGFVQLTWYENYQLLGRLLNVDLLNHPELALRLDIATKILFEGMTKGSSSIGDFTGKCLEMYFNEIKEDPIGARKIINGTDKAEKIAGYYQLFKKQLN